MDKNLTVQVLRGALEVLGSKGENWIKRDYGFEGKFCLAGALCESAIRSGVVTIEEGDDLDDLFYYYGDVNKPEFGEMADILSREVSLDGLVKEQGFAHVPDFNDNDSVVFSDVKLLIEQRIDRLLAD